MAYIVTAGYVTAETNIGPGRARVDITRGAELPADVPLAEVEALLRRGDVELVDEQPAEPGPDPDAVPEGTIPEVIDWVAGGKDRAQRALDAELAKGDKARSTLVDQLKQLAAGE
jgi:hypothetical protein